MKENSLPAEPHTTPFEVSTLSTSTESQLQSRDGFLPDGL